MPKGAADASQVRFFLDRSLGAHQVSTVLRAAGWHVTTLNERYGTREGGAIRDETWIADAAREDEILLCKDLRVGWIVAESETIYTHDARVFGLANAQRPASEMAGLFLIHQRKIVELATRKGPYLFSLSDSACKEKPIAYP